jgi:hypothetical protein
VDSYNIFSYKEIFSILMFILVMTMVSEKSSPSYAVPLNYNQLNSGYLYDNMRHLYDNAFSNLSRNMTFSVGGGGQALPGNLTSSTNFAGPNFTTGDINNNLPNNTGPDGTGDNDISSGSIFTQHGSSSGSPHIWTHRLH